MNIFIMITNQHSSFMLLLIIFTLSCHTTYASKIAEKTRGEVMTNREVKTAIESNKYIKIVNMKETVVAARSKDNQNVLLPITICINSIIRDLRNWPKDDMCATICNEDDNNSTMIFKETRTVGRTFGKIRRLEMMALVPIIFKFGILSAMVSFLVLLSIKTIFLIKILISINVLAILEKFFTLKTNIGYVGQMLPLSYGNWSPQYSSGLSTEELAVQHPNKEIHLHIHGSQLQPQMLAYSAYGSNNNQPKGQQQQNGWERSRDFLDQHLL